MLTMLGCNFVRLADLNAVGLVKKLELAPEAVNEDINTAIHALFIDITPLVVSPGWRLLEVQTFGRRAVGGRLTPRRESTTRLRGIQRPDRL